MLKAEIYITLKKTVVDPQGLVIKHALESLGFSGITQARCGKMITLELKLSNKKRAEKQIDTMCKKLLANPIIEDYHFRIKGK
ncbi:MAG: phosphoribosylformylglycinamidine synthase subunit PurS [Candidatus Omnitrophota bacterium]